MSLVVYPALSDRDFGFFRLGGAGLANCMFIAARAYILSQRYGCELLRPTWERFGLGQILRGERDKRLYAGLFRQSSLQNKCRHLLKLCLAHRIDESQLSGNVPVSPRGMVVVSGLGDYFEGLLPHYDLVRSFFDSIIEPSAISSVPQSMRKSVSVHVRMGDFPPELRVPISWYMRILDTIRGIAGRDVDIQIFSDGSDGELAELLSVPGARRAFYGNALADIIAISRSGLLVGSHSTFSGWGAFLGQVPSVFQRIDYGPILLNSRLDCRLGDQIQFPEELVFHIRSQFGG